MKLSSLIIVIPEMVWKNIENHLPFLIMVSAWFVAPYIFNLPQGNSEEIVTSIGLMVLLSFISFFVLIVVCWQLLQWFFGVVGLPGISSMVVQFNSLALWKQLKFILSLFALFLLAGVGTLMALA